MQFKRYLSIEEENGKRHRRTVYDHTIRGACIPIFGSSALGQVYNHTAVTTGTAQQPGFSSDSVAGAYSYTPPGGAQKQYEVL